MRGKGLERRSKKYAPMQNVSVANWYMDAEDFHQKHGIARVGVKKRMSPDAGRKNRIMIFGPKPDGDTWWNSGPPREKRWRSRCRAARRPCSNISKGECHMGFSCQM